MAKRKLELDSASELDAANSASVHGVVAGVTAMKERENSATLRGKANRWSNASEGRRLSIRAKTKASEF